MSTNYTHPTIKFVEFDEDDFNDWCVDDSQGVPLISANGVGGFMVIIDSSAVTVYIDDFIYSRDASSFAEAKEIGQLVPIQATEEDLLKCGFERIA